MVERWRHAARLEHDPLTAWCLARASAIASGRVVAIVSSTTSPSRSTTQTCVSFIETSSPAKCSMAALLVRWGADPIGLPKSSRLITPCCRSRRGAAVGNADFGIWKRHHALIAAVSVGSAASLVGDAGVLHTPAPTPRTQQPVAVARGVLRACGGSGRSPRA